jgi:hypothetical protein
MNKYKKKKRIAPRGNDPSKVEKWKAILILMEIVLLILKSPLIDY